VIRSESKPRPRRATDAMLIADVKAGALEECPHLGGRRVVRGIEPTGGQPIHGERPPWTQRRYRGEAARSQHPVELTHRGRLVEEVKSRRRDDRVQRAIFEGQVLGRAPAPLPTA
jgi:hypothetical protein